MSYLSRCIEIRVRSLRNPSSQVSEHYARQAGRDEPVCLTLTILHENSPWPFLAICESWRGTVVAPYQVLSSIRLAAALAEFLILIQCLDRPA